MKRTSISSWRRRCTTPQSLAERDLMRALLICQGASFEMIADVFKYDVDVVRLVDTLFWNVRDRKHGSVAEFVGKELKMAA